MRGPCRIFRFLKISDLESNTPDALRAGGFNRFAHSAGPGLKVKEMCLEERGEGKKREERRGKKEAGTRRWKRQDGRKHREDVWRRLEIGFRFSFGCV